MSIFVTGASGYIGGTVSRHFLDAGYQIRGLVRSREKADQLQAMGIEPIIGDIEDADLLEAEARRADGVINTARADHIASVNALLAGLKGSGKGYIQTSGTGMVSAAGDGNSLGDQIYDESSQLDITPERQWRYDVDLRVLAAANEGIRSAVICPPNIYGYGAGLGKDSIQIPYLIKRAREYNAVTIVGQINRWPQVHVDDLADLYLRVYRDAPAGSFYFAENGEAAFKDIAAALAKRLSMPQVKSLPVDEAEKLWGASFARYVFGGNSRVKGVRAREELGWQPKHSSVTEWIEMELVI